MRGRGKKNAYNFRLIEDSTRWIRNLQKLRLEGSEERRIQTARNAMTKESDAFEPYEKIQLQETEGPRTQTCGKSINME